MKKLILFQNVVCFLRSRHQLKENFFFQLKRDWQRGKERYIKDQGNKHVSYSHTISGNEEVEKYSMCGTLDVSLKLAEVNSLMLIVDFTFPSFSAPVPSTHHCRFHCKQCVVCFQVYQRCKSLGTTLGPHPQLSTKDHHCISRRETLWNCWEEMPTVHFGRYYSDDNHSVLKGDWLLNTKENSCL